MTFAANAPAALAGADALMILTEWKEFRSPDFDDIKQQLKQPIVFDGRNIYRGIGTNPDSPAALRREREFCHDLRAKERLPFECLAGDDQPALKRCKNLVHGAIVSRMLFESMRATISATSS